MTGTIALSGLGSGIDTASIVSGLVQADSGTLNAIQQRTTDTQAAVNGISDITSLMSALKTKLQALTEVTDAMAYSASSSDASVVASASGSAVAGSFSVTVSQLASSQRTYSDAFASATTALGQAGTLTLKVGSADALNITVTDTDSLGAIANKINGAHLDVTASTFFDGTRYRLQLQGTKTGAASSIAVTETGVSLGLTKAANTVQAAQDAKATIDGFDVTSSTNQITGAIQGVTLALTKRTTEPTIVTVAPDSSALATKIQQVVTAYNALVTKVHAHAGFGKQTADIKALAGDSTLRGLTDQLSSTLDSMIGTGKYNTVASLGLTLQNDGTIKLDADKLAQAVNGDPGAVAKVLAGSDTSKGVMDLLSDLADNFTASTSGRLVLESASLGQRIKDLGQQAAREQTRLDAYAETLRKQFAAMDSSVAANNSDMSYLTNLYSSKT